MKTNVLLFAAVLTFIAACDTKKHGGNQNGNPPPTIVTPNPQFSRFIPMDSANKMIGSYLNSISNTDSNLQSLSIDMDQLRRYTDTMTTTRRITHLKLFFAHTLEYINAGHGNQSAGYHSGALTLIIAGYDSSGKYVYFDGNNVLEYCAPCPYSCAIGDAGGSFLTQ